MSDFAREWSDAQLEELTARFNKAYSQAAEDMRLKLEVSLGRYAKENEARQKAMDDTPEARKAYEEWKRGQIADQNWLQGMVQSLSESATNANQHAMDMLNDTIPRIYTENANMAAFLVDNQLGYDTGFTLVSEDAVRYLMGLPDQEVGYDQLIREVTWTPEAARLHVQDLRKREVDYPKDMHWNRQKFSSAITQGILQGESIPNIVRRTKSIYGMNKNSAVRAARTATTNAENAGRMSSFERAQKLGIDMEIEWLATADGRTRDSHRALDGECIMVGEKFSNGLRWPSDPLGAPSEIWNCFVGDTKAVPLGELQRSFRRFYDGDAVTVITASGVNFTCTPNHPILTSKGWVAAGLLDDSYDLFVADLGNGLDGSGIKPDVEHVGTSLEAIHELVSMRLGNRASSLGVYFHEDVLTRNVDVVTEERSLRVNPETLRLEPIDEIGLELTDTLASSDSPEMEFARASMTTPNSLMSSGSEPRALLGSGISHALEHGLRTVSGCDSSPLEPDVYGVSTDAKVLGESLHALSAVVKLDHVVNVDVHPISTHVYNLQTESGTYLANSSDNGQVYIIAHNCRCRATGNVVGFDGKRGDWANERGERWTRLPKGMTYEEWKKAKPVSREKSYENESRIQRDFWREYEPLARPTPKAYDVDFLHPIDVGGVKRTSESMTFDKANELRGNPNYNMSQRFEREYNEILAKWERHEARYVEVLDAYNRWVAAHNEGEKYTINCQTCVVANEARRRGYDVQATGKTSGSLNEVLSHNTTLAWIDPVTFEHPDYIKYDGDGNWDVEGEPIPTKASYWRWLNEEGRINQGERYTIQFEWAGRSHSAHIVCLERIDEGLRIYDPQTGKKFVGAEVKDYLTRVKYVRTYHGRKYAWGPEMIRVDNMGFDSSIVDHILIGSDSE